MHARAEYVDVFSIRTGTPLKSPFVAVSWDTFLVTVSVGAATEPGCLRFARGWYHSTPPEGSPRAESKEEEKIDGSKSHPCGIWQRHALLGGKRRIRSTRLCEADLRRPRAHEHAGARRDNRARRDADRRRHRHARRRRAREPRSVP